MALAKLNGSNPKVANLGKRQAWRRRFSWGGGRRNEMRVEKRVARMYFVNV